MSKIKRVWIDQDVCLTHAYCEFVCPEVFELDAEGSGARIRPEAEQHFVSKALEIREAADGCPMACIHIEADGDEHTDLTETR